MNDAALAQTLFERLMGGLPEPMREALYAAIDVCRARGLGLFLVGGAVRDLLLERSALDLNLAIEGPTQPVAEALAWRLNGRQVLHERFGTANVSGIGFKLDLAQTRRETYSHPGALPAVEPVESILDDLSRRDFTVNAIALRLTPRREIIDPFGGVADIGAGLVRVLHEDSFRDDATRMLRAVRYATRLDFRIETLTELWLRRDLEFVETVTGARLRRELGLIFEERAAPEATLLAMHLGILGAIHPRLHIDPMLAQRWRRSLDRQQHANLDAFGFCLAGRPQSEPDVESLSGRLHLLGRVEAALVDLVRLRGLSAKLALSADDPVAVVEMLDGRSAAAVWALSVLDESTASAACDRYLSEWRHVRPSLTGHDLLALGLPKGERVGALLNRLRRARLSGEVMDREGEWYLAREEIAKMEQPEN